MNTTAATAEGALVELARCYGIENGYHDIWGAWHPLSDATARALLAAMGVPAADDDAVRRALQEAADDAGQALAPPVLVCRQGDSPRLPVCVTAAMDAHTLKWRIVLDGGDTRSGECVVHDLPLAAECGYDEGTQRRRRELLLPDDLCTGYHDLVLDVTNDGTRLVPDVTDDAARRVPAAADHAARLVLIVAPRRCHPIAAGRRNWGITLQLYALRSGRNWGVGDFGDLGQAIDTLSDQGADMVGLNPLHALFPGTPGNVSPYSPSSRRFLNPVYLHVEAMADFAECAAVRAQVSAPGFQRRLADLRATPLVDYEQAVPLKLTVLRGLYEHFRDRHLGSGSERAGAFRDYCDSEGAALRRHATFEALHTALGGAAPWPAALRDPDSPAVAEFVARNADDVTFAQYLQWQTALQLHASARRARDRGMCVGLYLDLAVGSDGHGADAWAAPRAHARDVSIGAPPDDFSLQGQVWGLPPWTPRGLREQAYRPFVDCLRSSMRHAGALRIDHVLGLMRQFWVPSGGSAADGAYVHFPLHDLLAVTALESAREGCVVVGEDLGTVPNAVRTAMAEFGLLSYRVLYFEKHWHGDHSFRGPGEYPRDALVTVSTHDLATFAGFWTGRDLDLRDALGLFPDHDAATRQRVGRDQDRWRLLDALYGEGLRPANPGEPGRDPPTPELVSAVHRFLARSPAALLSVQMDDVLGEVDQVNVPGTVDEHPNWRRKLSLPVEAWAQHPALHMLARAVREERGP